MANPKTTITGALMMVSAAAVLIAHALSGGLTAADINALLAALGGLGLIAARDAPEGPVLKLLKRHLTVLVVAAVAVSVSAAACTTMSVTSPDGRSTASYKGTTMIGALSLLCGVNGVCSESGQDVTAIASAVAPIVAAMLTPTPQATPAVTGEGR